MDDAEDMPDFTAVVAQQGPGTVDDMLDEADELEDMLEVALEEAEEEEQRKPAKQPQPQQTSVAPPGSQPPTTLPTPPSGVALVQDTTQHAIETMPRTANGLIDVDRLTLEQHRALASTMMSMLTPEQQERYEAFRRSSLKEPMKQLIQAVAGSKPDSQSKLLIALSSVAKSFVGELVEEGRRVAEGEGHRGGGIEPGHIVEAYRRLKTAGLVESVESGRKPNRLRL